MARIVRVYDDAEAASHAAAAEFVSAAREAIAARNRCTVALSGGATPRRLYQLLAAEPFRARVDWTRVEFFWSDERAVPPDHEQSNFRLARLLLLERLPVPAAHIHRIHSERGDRQAAALDYEGVIAGTCGAPPGGRPPALDLALLGLGADGHTASLFPFTAALAETARWVVVNDVPQLRTQRFTFTVPLLNQFRQVIFLVSGGAKAAAVAAILAGPPEPLRFPAQLVQPAAGRLLWLLDRAAAAGLGSERG